MKMNANVIPGCFHSLLSLDLAEQEESHCCQYFFLYSKYQKPSRFQKHNFIKMFIKSASFLKAAITGRQSVQQSSVYIENGGFFPDHIYPLCSLLS